METITLSLASGLADFRTPAGEKEFEVIVVTQTPGNIGEDELLPFRLIRHPSVGLLWNCIRDSDVLHLAGPALAPLFLAWLARKPVVIEHHTYQSICPNGLLIHQPDRLICPGHFQARRYLRCLRCQANEVSWLRALANLLLMFPRHFLSRIAASNIAVTQHVLTRHKLPRSFVIYHGVPESMERESQVDSAHMRPATICFAYVGRLVAEKGLPVLLLATQKLKKEGRSFKVQLIGDGPERSRLEATIKRDDLETHVCVTGYLRGDALQEALRKVQVLTMPSVWEETAGLAAIEQMMRGKLVIASDTGGLGEVLDEAGLRCPAGDADALADCMRAVLSDPSLIESLGRKARERALLLFRRPRMLEQHVGVYRQLLREMRT